MRIPPKETIKKIYCNTCKLKTNHVLGLACLRQYNQQWADEIQLSGQENMYCFWICQGCETAVFEDIYSQYDWSGHEISTFYPTRENELRQILEDYHHLPPDLWHIYKEIIQGFNARLHITCAMGIRALLEGICVEQEITDSKAYPLKRKLEILKEKLKEKDETDIPPSVLNALDHLKNMGDGAAHRLEFATPKKLKQAIDFTEHLLEFIYKIERQKNIDKLSNSSSSFIANGKAT